MYRPKKYIKDDKDFVFSFMKAHPFATLIMQGERLLATHIPVMVEGDAEHWRLHAHIANHNELTSLLKDGAEALIIFKGADGYISSSWYKEKDISTWDYSAVHVNAKVQLQSSEELENSLEMLVKNFETHQDNPLFYKDIPEQMLQEHLPLITGFWLAPCKVEGVAKLHQSYPAHDVEAVTEKLKSSGDSVKMKLAEAIQEENKFRKR